MKKILSAVFVMAMLIITATITSTVLAAEPYQYTPADGKPVVYVSSTGDVNASIAATSNGKEFADLASAVKELGKKDGYVVLLDDIDIGRSGVFPAHSADMITIRGRDDVDEFVKIKGRFMCSTRGNYTFDNLHLAWYKVDSSDNDQSLQLGTYKTVFGSEGNPDSIQVSGMEVITGSNITVNGGTFSIRMATWGSDLNTSEINITLNGGKINNISGAHSGPNNKVFGSTVTGDVNITVNGGVFAPAGFNFSQPANNRFIVGGDYVFTVNGGTLSAGTITPIVSGKTPKEFSIAGNTIVNILGYEGDKAALASKFKASDWDLCLTNPVYVSEAGDDANAGTADAPVATYAKAAAKLGTAGGVIYVLDSITLDNVTEAAHTGSFVFAGEGAVVINGDYNMAGPAVFMGVNIKNGENGAIVAGGNNLVVMSDVKTTAGADGKYIDIIAGKKGEFVPVSLTIKAGTFNKIDPTGLSDGSKIEIASGVKTITSGVKADLVVNTVNLSKGTPVNATIELIDFVDGLQAVKVTPLAADVVIDYAFGNVDPSVYKFAKLTYYLNLKDTVDVYPQIKIGEEVITAEKKAVNGWNVASFDISGIAAPFGAVTFLPYGEADVASYNKMYALNLAFSQMKGEKAPEYSTDMTFTASGDYIPVLDDFVLTSDLVNTLDRTNINVENAPFVVGSATRYTPLASTGVETEQAILLDGTLTSLRGDFQPYVKVEYYMYARETDTITDAYPTIKIGTKTYVATEKLVANKWAVATFNIGDYGQEFQSFVFAPYGDAAGLNEWNKLYVQQVKFSQTEDKTVPSYMKPDMTENGVLIPYVFDPAEEGLEVHPVIYVNVNGGILSASDSIEKSTDSTNAYGSLAAAFSAANTSKKVVYAVLVDDVVVGSIGTSNLLGYVNQTDNFPSNSNTVIIRGMTRSDDTRTSLIISRMPRINGPLWFQNIDILGCSTGDTYFALQGYNVSIGAPGGSNTDVKFGTASVPSGTPNIPVFTFGGDGGNHTRSPIVSIYSGTINTTLKLSGAYGATIMQGDVTINVYGGDLTNTAVTNGHSLADKNMGNVYINIAGGKLGNKKWEIVNNSNSYIDKNVYVKVSGNPDMSAFGGLSIAKYNAENTTGLKGIASLDILEYEGDFEALKAKFNLSDFYYRNVNSIYVKDGGTGNGTSEANAFGNLADAIAACSKADDTGIEGGRIVICGDGFTVEGVVNETTAHENTILYTSVNGAALKFASGTLELAGPVTFKNITLENTNSDDAFISGNGHKVVFETNVKGVAADGKYVSVVGSALDSSAPSADITINSGKFQDVKAGGNIDGNVSITINGGEIVGNVVGGSSANDGVIGGKSEIIINGGEFSGKVIGGNDAAGAVINGTAYIELNGGTFKSGSTIIASNDNANATVKGNAEVKINNADISAMADNAITKGIGTCGDKVCADYKNYEGNISDVEGKVAKNFDVIVVKPAEKPVFTESDKFVFIIEHYGDPTKALTKAIPFKITQSAAQTGAPIVVSPKQLNLKVDGADHAILSLQTIKDTADTIRLVPNHNPTKGSRIVLDGYNINGRGVDVTKYKYAEVVYYYTVPEGDTPAVANMAINFVGKSSQYGSATSTEVVANKWATVIFDFNETFAGKEGTLAQYHFSPMGGNKKGTDVPVNQYLDIISLTFYTDKPQTKIQGGNIPSAKIKEEEKPTLPTGPAKPAKIEDIVVNVVNLKSTVDNSGAFTAAQVTKDGMTVMEYTPNLESAKELRIEGYNCMGKQISLNDYQYLTMKVLVETKRTDVTFKTQITNCNGGVADNPEKAKGVTWTAETPLVPNEWTTVTLKIAPTDPAFHITRQFHIAPIGMIKGNTMVAGEKFYLAEFVLSNQPPKAAGAAEDEEIVEEEVEVIAEAPAVVVDGAKLINSAGDYATFKSTVGEFDGKKVVVIKPNNVAAPVAIDGSAIFGKSEQTPDGALSLKTHRYAVISYYYASEEDAERIPEFELLGGRIQSLGNVVNSVKAKGTAGLKKNEWATAIVKLSGNGEGVLTSGFNLMPFGGVNASAVNGVLYIENITFVSNRPQ